MSARTLPGPLSRLWPRKVRTRLTLLYATLFCAAGTALLALTYGLLASSLSGQAPASVASQEPASLSRACHLPGNQPVPLPLLRTCKQQDAAYIAGVTSGSRAQRQRALSELLEISLAGLAVMTAASGALGWIMSGRVLGPVRMITQTARRASEQHLGERLAMTGARDELRELGDTFDDMLHRLDTAFAAQRRFVASASHELRTPLTLMRTAIEVTLAKPSPTTSQLSDMAIRIRGSIDRAETMIEALLTLAISDQGTLRTEFTDLATCAEDALDAAAPQIERLGLHLDTSLAPAETSADPHLLDRVVANLIDNAIRHNQPGGWIKLSTGSTDSAACLQIANSGPHIPDDVIPALFEPFQRMQPRTGAFDGVGLGLSIAQSAITAHHGTLTARSQPTGGLHITVTIPRGSSAEPHSRTGRQLRS